MPENNEGFFARMGVLLTSAIGAFSILGAPVTTITAILLFLISWGFGAYELRVQAKRRHWKKLAWVTQVAALCALGWCIYSSYYIFVVQMSTRSVTSLTKRNDPSLLPFIEFGVQLTNRGKPTSLTSWKAYLLLPGGAQIYGNIARMSGDNVRVGGDSRELIPYKLPDCDLTLETAKAMQTGDSVFGVISFSFPGLDAKSVSADTKVVLQANDMLGRSIVSDQMRFGDLDKMEKDVFPCPLKEQ